MLRVMGVSTLIESARLGSQAGGFEALAGEVKDLADGIEQNSREILEGIERNSRLVDETRRRISEMDKQQRAAIAQMTAECAGSLEEIANAAARVREATDATERRYRSLAAEVGEIVAALQIHDSTRQRIEHVVESLEHVSQNSHAIQLQAAHLAEAKRAFREAVEGIREGLGSLAGSMDDCAANAARLSEEGSGENFARKLEGRFEAIIVAVENLAQLRRSVDTATNEVREACTRMSGFVGNIEVINGRMLRLALNAEIKAVQLAGTGIVMEAVAEGIRSTSENAATSAGAASRMLRDLENIAGGAGNSRGAESGEEIELLRRIRSLCPELVAAGERSWRLVDLIATGSARVNQEIALLRDSISVDRLVDDVVDPCLEALETLASRTNGEAVAGALAHMHRRYTMHGERQVHERFLRADKHRTNQRQDQGSLERGRQ